MYVYMYVYVYMYICVYVCMCIYIIYIYIYIYILGVGIIRVNYAINAINLASRLTRLYLSYRLIFSLSFKKNSSF